jgi:hypothetical protein
MPGPTTCLVPKVPAPCDLQAHFRAPAGQTAGCIEAGLAYSLWTRR